MLSCFLCMVNEVPPRFLFNKNEGTAKDTEKKFSLARFQSVKFRCKHSTQDRGMRASTWKNTLIAVWLSPKL